MPNFLASFCYCYCLIGLALSTNCALNPTEKLSESTSRRELLENSTNVGPKNTTGYIGGNISINATVRICPRGILTLFVNDYKLSQPCTSLSINSEANGLENLLYTINGLQVANDNTRVDVCVHCGSYYECFLPAYFNVKGRPVLSRDTITVLITCHGVCIIGSIDKDTTLTIELRDYSNTSIIYNKTNQRLPHCINDSILDPTSDYKLLLVGRNGAGNSEPFHQNVSFENMTEFSIKDCKVMYHNNTPRAIIGIDYNTTCPLSKPRVLYIESDCLPDGRKEMPLHEPYHVNISLLANKPRCKLTLWSRKAGGVVDVDTTPVTNISVYPNVTTNGYVHINATLLDGVPGMMTITKYTNGSVCWNQSILRDFPNVSYAGANNTEPLTNGSFLMTVYALRDDGSFDRGYPIKENISITSIVAKRDNGPNHTSGGFSIWLIITIIGSIILVVAIFAITITTIIILRRRYPSRFRIWRLRGERGGGGGGPGAEQGEEEPEAEQGNIVQGARRDEAAINEQIEIPNVVADRPDEEPRVNNEGANNNHDEGNRNNEIERDPVPESPILVEPECPAPFNLVTDTKEDKSTGDKGEPSISRAVPDDTEESFVVTSIMETTKSPDTSGKPVVQGQSYSTGVQSSSVEATSETYLLEQKNPKWNLKDVFKKKKGIAKVAVTPSNNSLSDLAQPISLYDNTDTSPYETHITAETETEHERTPKFVSGSTCPTPLPVTEDNAISVFLYDNKISDPHTSTQQASSVLGGSSLVS